MWCSAHTAQSTRRPRRSSSKDLQKVPFPRVVMLLKCHFGDQWNMAPALNSSALGGVGNSKSSLESDAVEDDAKR
jgi:hypothetical protein